MEETVPLYLRDVFEAFLGALYLDKGFDTALHFLEKHVFPKIDTGAFSHGMDYKSKLQEIVQQDKNQTIDYQIIEEKGPSHNKEFVAELRINDKVLGSGIGRTKKEAEQRAAKKCARSTWSIKRGCPTLECPVIKVTFQCRATPFL